MMDLPDWAMTALLATGFASAGGAGVWLRHLRPNRHHRRMMAHARRALPLLRARSEEAPGAVIAYVRKMHPHAVEELVLLVASRSGLKIKRNRAYTGDGGVDGQIRIDGRWHLVQTKRYSSAINPQHVRAFALLCNERGKPGLFVHTGRTGEMSRSALGEDVRVVSGSSLVDWIAGRRPAVVWSPSS